MNLSIHTAPDVRPRLGRLRLSPSCPFRLLHTFLSFRPARHYPRLWIRRSSYERRRDFNPPDLGAAQRTLRPCSIPAMAAACRDVEAATLARDGPPPITRTTFPACRARYPGESNGCACRLLPRFPDLPP
jgi:hypothetical protein